VSHQIVVHEASEFWTVLVAVGTLVLAVAALWSARAAININRRNGERQRWRDERQERAAARLVWGELLAAQEAAARAMDEGEWPLWETMSRASWDRNGHRIAAALTEDDFWQVVHTYDLVSGWQDRVDRHASEFPGAPGGAVAAMDIRGSLERERAAAEAIGEANANLLESLKRLKSVAFPDGREIPPNPDERSPWWKIVWWRGQRRLPGRTGQRE
jgi:hypothetical protein